MYSEALEHAEANAGTTAFRDPNDYASMLERAATEAGIKAAQAAVAAGPKYKPHPKEGGGFICLNCEATLEIAKPFCDSECCTEYDYIQSRRK
jgi:hypothetical protein